MRILIVGMADSIHLSRWIAQFDSSSTVFEIISSSPHRKVQSGITDRAGNSKNLSMKWFSRYFSLAMWLADRLLSDWVRGAYIAWRISRFKPEIVHVHELQNAGYATRRAYQLLGETKPKLIVTNYGSEIVWFSQFPSHRKRLKALLEIADGFSAECTRDYKLAKRLASGFIQLPLMPVAGGLDKNQQREILRNRIAIKGYENHWGKALVALNAVTSIRSEIPDLEVVLYSCNMSVVQAAKEISRSTNLKITTHKKGTLSHSQVLDLFRSSLIYIGHSISDGISTSMLEAMSMGAIPIQTNSSCAEEWVTDQETGFLVTPNDQNAITAAILKIVRGEFDVNRARLENYDVIGRRYNPERLSIIATGYYETFMVQSSN